MDRAGCIRCHRVGRAGGDVGPDLSDIGGKYGREHLIESVLEPSRQIVEGYRPTSIATGGRAGADGSGPGRDGRGADPLVTAEARAQVVRKARSRSGQYADASIMPEGLTAGCRSDQFADLIAYLESLRSAGEADARQRGRRATGAPRRVRDRGRSPAG